MADSDVLVESESSFSISPEKHNSSSSTHHRSPIASPVIFSRTGSAMSALSDRSLLREANDDSTCEMSDSIFKYLKIPEVCMRFVNTVHVQRLREISCHDLAHFVLPSLHNDYFTYSLTLCHMSGVLLQRLRESCDGECPITTRDILCVQVAALCYNLGRAPLGECMMRYMDTTAEGRPSMRRVSLKVFDDLLNKNDSIFKMVEKSAGMKLADLHFIRELIHGCPLEPSQKYVGREAAKSFLYDIIEGAAPGLSVSAICFAFRTSQCAGLGIPPVLDTYIESLRLLPCRATGQLTISVHVDALTTLTTLLTLHYDAARQATRRRDVVAVELMMLDALRLVAPHFDVCGEVSLPECLNNPARLLQLTDGLLLSWIRGSAVTGPVNGPRAAFQRAQTLIEDAGAMSGRRRYPLLGESIISGGGDCMVGINTALLHEIFKQDDYRDKLIAVVEHFDFNLGDTNPFEQIFVHRSSSDAGDRLTRQQVSAYGPKFATLTNRYARLYSRAVGDTDFNERAAAVFEEFCECNNWSCLPVD